MTQVDLKHDDNRESVGDILETKAPDVSPAEATAIARIHYGISGYASPLNGERDHNFHIATDGLGEYVLKIAHPAECPETADFQTKALLHIAAVASRLAVPAVRPTIGGELQPAISIRDEAPRITRLLTYLPGQLLCNAQPSARQDRNLGIFLALLGKALRGFFHPAAGNDLLWDIRKLPKTKPLLVHVEDVGKRALLERHINEYEGHAAILLPGLRAQVIHNDMNPNNVVVNEALPESVAGILDFGDMLHAPLICDVAIGAMYRWTSDEHPLAGAARFVSGYRSVQPLEDAEIDLLFDLIKARLALTAGIVEWQAKRFPEKRSYVLRSNSEIWSSIVRLSKISRDEARRYFYETE